MNIFIDFDSVCRVHLGVTRYNGLSLLPELYQGLRFRGHHRQEICDDDIPEFLRRYAEWKTQKRAKRAVRFQLRQADQLFFAQCMKTAYAEIWRNKTLGTRRERKHAIRLRCEQLYRALKQDLYAEKRIQNEPCD